MDTSPLKKKMGHVGHPEAPLFFSPPLPLQPPPPLRRAADLYLNTAAPSGDPSFSAHSPLAGQLAWYESSMTVRGSSLDFTQLLSGRFRDLGAGPPLFVGGIGTTAPDFTC